MEEILSLLLILVFLAGATVPSIIANNRRLSLTFGCLLGAIGSVISLYLAIEGLLFSEPIRINLGHILPSIFLELYIDKLSAFFILTITIVSLLTSIYSIRYMKIYAHENMAWWSFCYNLFILSMILVVTVNNIILFLLFWEVMTLTSYFLVTFSFRREQVRKAGFVYLVMTHIGTVFITSAFFLLSSTGGGWGFDSLIANAKVLNPEIRNVIFLCALIGFGTKAGMVPLHVWLPQAHPAAPTNISALMSGVMLKTAIYGMIRVIMNFLGSGPSWWGVSLMTLGVITAVVGVISALMQQDLKRLLAYSSVENIGIIMMGLGTSIIFSSWKMPVPTAIALGAALFHVLNHAIFKSLLFLCTGSIYYVTHTKDMEKLGGLLNKMPYTAVLFLIGALSISAIPPFNGFASEYQLYRSLLMISFQDISGFWVIGGIIACTFLALTGVLAAACFIKAFGITFLALPRSEKVSDAKEVPLTMTVAVLPLGLLCLILGIISGPLMEILVSIPNQLIEGTQSTHIQNNHYVIFFLVTFVMVLIAGIMKFLGAKEVRRTETWGCGIEIDASMEYTGASFTQPIRRVYSPLLRPKRRIRTEYSKQPYFGYRIIFNEYLGSNIKDHFYVPIRQGIIRLSRKWQLIQSGNMNWYLGYIFITIVILLGVFSKGG